MSSWKIIGVALAAAALALAGGLLWNSRAVDSADSAPETPISSALRSMLEAQRALPPASQAALQDLRLIAAVEMTHFTSKGRYEAPEQLQESEELDSGWPRAAADAYRIHCQIQGSRLGFVCNADALEADLLWFEVDATQALRYARGRRPGVDGPIFGLKEVQ